MDDGCGPWRWSVIVPRRPAFASILCVMAGGTALASAVVSGLVVDRGRSPQPGVKVIVAPSDASLRSYPVKTNDKGEFFVMVQNGSYTVMLDAKGPTLDSMTERIESRRSDIPGVPESGGKMRSIFDWSGRLAAGQAPPRLNLSTDDRAIVELVVVDDVTARREQAEQIKGAVGRALQAGDRAAAERAIDELLDKSPDDAQGLMLRGYVGSEAGRLEQAEADFERALELEPKLYDARYQLAALYRRTGRASEALEAFGRAAEDADSGANRGKARLNVGELEREAGRLPQAIAAFEQAIAADPSLEQTVAPELANLYTQTGDTARAEAWLAKAGKGAADPAVEYNVGVAHFNGQEWEPAAASFRKVVASDPKNADAYKNLGIALLNLGQKAEAAEAFRSFLALRPEADDSSQVRSILESLER